MNPFKFGTIVKNEFFTDRVKELEQVKQMYKTYYNDTFKQMTGRSWLDSDN